MRKNISLIFLFLLIASVLSIYSISQSQKIRLNIDIECEEYWWHGEAEDDGTTFGMGTLINLNGDIKYNSSTATEIKKVITKISVYDVNGFRIDEEIPINLNSNRVSSFKKELDFANSPSCYEQKYSISFYSPTGDFIAHKGDFENSINNPLYSGPSPTPNLTTEALVDSLILTAQAYVTQQSNP